MSVAVRIPTPLRKHTDGHEVVDVDGRTAGEVLQNLAEQHPDLREKIFTDEGDVRRFVNVFANDRDIRFQDGIETSVEDGDEMAIVPAIAGGVSA